jgi:hypothetical protein
VLTRSPVPLQGRTWWGEDGYCYYDSPDGWRYYWEGQAQHWQQYQYLGTSDAQRGLPGNEVQATKDPGLHHAVQAAVAPQQEQGRTSAGTASTPFQTFAASSFAEPSVTSTVPVSASQSAFSTFQASSSLQPNLFNPALTASTGSFATHPGGAAGRELGRPAAFAKFVFGGKLLMMSPDGKLSMRSLLQLPTEVLEAVGSSAPGPSSSLRGVHSSMADFPGPLVQNTSKDKVCI